VAEELEPTSLSADDASSDDAAGGGSDTSPAAGAPVNGDRVARFRAEVAELGLRDPVVNRERTFIRLGAVAMALGVVWVIVSYFVGHSTRNPLQQRDMVVSALFGLTLVVVGGVLYLRYSFGRFLRFWLARSAFEQAQQTEQLVEALRGTGDK
jgi:hypothetical protein